MFRKSIPSVGIGYLQFLGSRMDQAQEIVYRNLRESRHFKDISDEALQRFLSLTQYKSFQDQEIVLKQGTVNREAYILLSGQAVVKVDDKYIYTLSRKGDVMGEMSIITGNTSSATVEAFGYLEAIQVSNQVLHNVQDDAAHELHAIFYRWFSQVLADKLYLTSQKAKLHEEAEKLIAEKNQELEGNISELKVAYDKLRHTRIELEESKRVTALRQTFQKFVPEQYLNRIAASGVENIEAGRAIDDFVTVLFSDIRKFTTLCEKMSPEEVFKFLSAYLSRMSEPIHQHGGFIDKFIGDAIMAIFNRPEGTDEDEAQTAIQAALSLQQTLILYNQHRANTGYPPLSIGIGIHSGPAMMGTVGSDTRMDFTVIGDTVNLASRLESLTKYYEVSCIISQATYKLLDISPYNIRELDTVQVKGKTEKVVIFEVFSGFPSKFHDAKHNLLIPYNRGLIHFQMQDWEEAIYLFQECLRILPEDRASQFYLERSQYLQEHPPGEEWDYVFRIDNK